MNIPGKIKTFLSDSTDISIGYNEIKFFHPENLEEEQTGYSVDLKGNPLVTGKAQDWQKEWLVIAIDLTGDPIIVDLSIPGFTILSAAHGEGSWTPFIIANNLESFKSILSILQQISKKRTNPVELEKNPISENEKQNALKKIEEQNPDADMWFWENFFEND